MDKTSTVSKFENIILICLSAYFLLLVIFSLQWRLELDSPLMAYLAFLMDRYHYVPYRDFFDMNMPGTYLINLITGRLFGFSDFGFRCADLIYLGAILTATFLWMRKLGWKVAWCGTVLFGIIYLRYGPAMSLQRDYFIILPTILSLLISSLPKLNIAAKCSIIGFLFGLSATVKPHSAIALPLVLLFLLFEVKQQDNSKSFPVLKLFLILLSSAAGFAVPIFAMFFYLWKIGALPAFLDIANNYWPLYNSLNGELRTIGGLERINYLINGYFTFGGKSFWFAPSVIGIFISLFHSNMSTVQKRQVLLLIGMAFCFSIYTVFADKFWTYHWLLFSYFLLLLSSLCLVKQVDVKTKFQRVFPIAILLVVIFIHFRPSVDRDFFKQVRGYVPPESSMGRRFDIIASYLKANLKTGDKVQPLDWAGSAAHALLIAEIPLATPFMYDFHFYHHVSNKYIQNLRKKFIEKSVDSKPKFIIQIKDRRSWPSGVDSTREFKELELFLAQNYSIAFIEEGGYAIYKRNKET